MSKVKTIILDSSVIIKWFLPEEDSNIALAFNRQFISGDLKIAVPMLLFYEMANIFKSAVTASRIKSSDAIQSYENLLNLNFITYSMDNLFKGGLEIALRFDITAYDASYLALAEELKIPFITADQKLINKVESKQSSPDKSGKLIFNLNDYEL